ncbi:Hypothetical predicted protein [Lecanosticta acicola]|uniref:Protein kinase domain-containing protein n=1 Tax=Lecanosticta acicola TaxID=111012 RepID=A0AAI8Z8W9_9PEZI|nr:Hypothetical predicted protein [Lecanosticta acicola]
MKNHGLTLDDADHLLEPNVTVPGVEAVFERVRAMTDFRKDDVEARVLFICRRRGAGGSNASNSSGEDGDDLYILKCKVQAPSVLAGGLTTPIPGPSRHTADELRALESFTQSNSPSLPHLIGWKTAVQGDDGPMPGGYIVYIVMTLMPGKDLLALKFWSMTEAERREIRDAFLVAIKRVWSLGFKPYDCALRNILWEEETKKLSIVDFEHWNPMDKDIINMSEREELMDWGLASRPPPSSHWEQFFRNEGLKPVHR